MDKWGNTYNLYHGTEIFMKDAKREGFDFEKSPGENAGNYDITKKVTPNQEYSNKSVTVGHIFDGHFLVISSLPLPMERKDIRRKQVVEQLERLAKDFIVDQPKKL